MNSLTGGGASTLSAWVKQAADSGDYGSSILSLGNGGTSDVRFLLSSADDEQIKCGFYGNDRITTTVLPLAAWKHVAWV